MMKFLVFISVFLSLNTFADDTYRQKILKLKNQAISKSREDIHKTIIKIKKNAEATFNKLNEGNEYDPDTLYYSVTIDNALISYPENLDEMRSCSALKQEIISSYKSKWKELPTPIHDIWPLILKTCKR